MSSIRLNDFGKKFLRYTLFTIVFFILVVWVSSWFINDKAYEAIAEKEAYVEMYDSLKGIIDARNNEINAMQRIIDSVELKGIKTFSSNDIGDGIPDGVIIKKKKFGYKKDYPGYDPSDPKFSDYYMFLIKAEDGTQVLRRIPFAIYSIADVGDRLKKSEVELEKQTVVKENFLKETVVKKVYEPNNMALNPSYFKSVDKNNLINYGYLLLETKNYDGAKQVFENTRNAYPKWWNSYDSYGDYYIEIGDNEKALKYFEEAHSLCNDENSKKEIENKIKKLTNVKKED